MKPMHGNGGLSSDIARALVEPTPRRLRFAHRVATHRAQQAKEIGWRALEQSWTRDVVRIEHRMRALGVPVPMTQKGAA